MTRLGPVDWLICCGYLVLVFGLGLWFMRGQESNEEYFVGNRRMSWWAVGVSLFATAFSSLSFVALPSEGAFRNYHLLVTYLMIPLVITPILWWLFVPIYRRLEINSVYEYLEVRFSPAMRRLGTLLFALYAIGWMGSMVYATVLILKAVMHLDDAQFRWAIVGVGAFVTLYTTLGGVKAVVWTDVLQAATLGGGMLVILLLALGRIDGGLPAVVRMGAEQGKFQMFDFTPDLTVRATFWSACSLGLFAYLPGYTTSQITVQRYLCTKDLTEARRSLLINAAVAVVVAVLFFFVGTVIYVFYHQAGGAGFPQLDKDDQILPHFVLAELSVPGMTGLLLAGLFAAVMSTISSGINSLTAVVVYDWLPRRELSVGVSRALCAALGLTVIGAALVAPLLGEHVIDIISVIAGAFLGLLLGVFLMGMLVPRANTGGALIGLIVGAVSLVYVWTQTDVAGWWYGAFTCLPTFVAGIAASFLFPAPRPDQRRGLALWLQRDATPQEL